MTQKNFEIQTMERLHKLMLDHHCGRQTLDSYMKGCLCAQLKSLQLPRNLSQRVDYLVKERGLLIQIISDYQEECKVI